VDSINSTLSGVQAMAENAQYKIAVPETYEKY
jgi:hypothetical protein